MFPPPPSFSLCSISLDLGGGDQFLQPSDPDFQEGTGITKQRNEEGEEGEGAEEQARKTGTHVKDEGVVGWARGKEM